MPDSPNISGQVAPGFEPVHASFQSLWDDIEVGASLHITVDGNTVVDLWGGYCDREGTVPWQQDTLVNVYSTSKGIVALAIACLVDDGLLDYTAPVCDYWPEFGAEEKFDITVSQLLSHQAGLYRFDPAVSVENLYDWQAMTFNLASQPPAWQPGSAFGYHSITWGYLAGELIRRVTSRTVGTYIRERITSPLEVDFHIGLTEAEQARCASLIGPNHARKPIEARKKTASSKPGSLPPSGDPTIRPFQDICSAAWRSAEIPASNGHASAAGLGRCFAASLDGRLLSPETLAAATAELTQGETDLVLGQKLRRSNGFILNCPDVYFGPSEAAFGHTGTGGSSAFADPVSDITFAYVMNQLHPDGRLRSRQLIDALYNCL